MKTIAGATLFVGPGCADNAGHKSWFKQDDLARDNLNIIAQDY
jgi:hypothetical protein